MDRFKVETNDMGKLIGIRIRHDNTGVYPSWYLDRVEIRDKNDLYEFMCHKWLSDHRDDRKIERIIMEKSFKKSPQKPKLKPRPKSSKDKKNSKQKQKPIKENYYDYVNYYYVKVYTGDKQSLAGTDLHASITLFGDYCVSKAFKLCETKTHEKKFFGNHVSFVKFCLNRV